MVFDRTIREVIDENYVYARALHYLGIDFFDHQEKQLIEVCKEKGINKDQLIHSFYQFDSCHRFSFKELMEQPIELLTEYLKHSHHLFIKERLPFITYLTKKWDGDPSLNALLFEFIEDFIKHIYEEEDSTFRYISLLLSIKNGKENAPHSKLMAFANFSLSNEFKEHKEHDELQAIRTLVSGLDGDCLCCKVLTDEIKAFDREMIYHAQIENQVFFPKAIELEEKVQQKIQQISTQN